MLSFRSRHPEIKGSRPVSSGLGFYLEPPLPLLSPGSAVVTALWVLVCPVARTSLTVPATPVGPRNLHQVPVELCCRTALLLLSSSVTAPPVPAGSLGVVSKPLTSTRPDPDLQLNVPA